MISIPLFLDDSHPCSYLDKRNAQFAYVHPDFELNTDIYSALIEQGFRRSGNYTYQPQCASCTACISTKLSVQDFKPSRQQRRVLKKNKDIQVNIKPAIFDEQHFSLYQHYLSSRHADGVMENSTKEDYMAFFGSHWCSSYFVEFLIEEELAGVAVIDHLSTGLSAVYTFFDPKFSSRSLGVYAVLWQIEHAKSLQLDNLYLGYWVEGCQKMAYKTNYQPLQGLIEQQWQDI
ncbi:MAG: arginyltransferase [Methyloprofundus sp.]|nr:arginyltransferase [Methyloprofundus sp.]